MGLVHVSGPTRVHVSGPMTRFTSSAPHTLMLNQPSASGFKSLHALGEQLNASGWAGKSSYHSILLITLWGRHAAKVVRIGNRTGDAAWAS